VEGLARKRGRKLPEVRRLAQNRDGYRKWLLKPQRLTANGNDEEEEECASNLYIGILIMPDDF
jgi:hypothetical protein